MLMAALALSKFDWGSVKIGMLKSKVAKFVVIQAQDLAHMPNEF